MSKSGLYPVPLLKYFPQEYVRTPRLVQFSEAWDKLFTELACETIAIKYFRTPERCPSQFLFLLADKFGVNFLSSDTDRLKRIKIRDAIATHKKKDRFDADIKLKIDAITGLSASLIDASFAEDMVWDESSDDNDNMIWLEDIAAVLPGSGDYGAGNYGSDNYGE